MKRKLIFTITLLLWAVFFNGCKKDEAVDLAGITLSKTSTTLKPEVTEALTVTFFP
jgi:hypothetical protein